MLKLIKGGTLIDCTGKDPVKNAAVLVDGEKIVKVGNAATVQVATQDVEVFDATGKTILPGLIDAHVHITGSGDPDRLKSMKELVPHMAIRTAKQAKATLDAGITALRDAGGGFLVDVAVKQAINEGLIPGPRLQVACHGISITGGHGDSRNGWPPEIEFKGRIVVDSPDEARRAAREQLRDGADHVKLHATGGVMSEGDIPTARGLTFEEMRAAIEEANNVGKKTMSHAQGSTGIKNAVLAGINSIDHGFYLTDDIIELMIKKDVFLVPTLAAVHHIVVKGTEAGIPDYGVRKAREAQAAHLKSFKKALDAGVKIAMGTDAATPYNYHGKNMLELELMVAAGMTPKQALLATTRMAAELMTMLDKIGTVEEGKLADIVVVSGNPLDDVRVLQPLENIKLVMKGGQVVANRGLPVVMGK